MPESFLGSGWQFPIRVTGRGDLAYSRGERDIAEAIWLILATAPGERVMRPDFGCGIHDFVFAPNNAETRGAIAYAVQHALIRWEPRIDVLDVRIETHPENANTLLIYVDYQIRANNALHNIVYPFSVTEGTEAGVGVARTGFA